MLFGVVAKYILIPVWFMCIWVCIHTCSGHLFCLSTYLGNSTAESIVIIVISDVMYDFLMEKWEWGSGEVLNEVYSRAQN